MHSDTYELCDISTNNTSDNTNDVINAKNGDGMYISTAKAFILAFLAIAIAVGVGIIVHFAGPARDFECSCSFPENNGGITATFDQCKDWAAVGNNHICKSFLLF